ncbi:MAG: CBS domain-containing protein [Chitinophagaceae bacterium]
MLNKELIQSNFPTLHLKDKVEFALQLMDDYDVQHLSVTDEEHFLGIISKQDLIDTNESFRIETLQHQFLNKFVPQDAFFSQSLALMSENELSIVAVTNNEHQYIGSITVLNIINALNKFLDTSDNGAVIVLEVDKRHYSFGEISRLIETNNAYITQLNTFFNNETGLTTVTIKLNTNEVSDIIATLQRYDYHIVHYFGEEAYANEIKENYNHLMAYLNI